MQNVVSVKNLSKTYSNQFQALNNINLDIKQNEIFALLGPNGAGKTTLISIICGIVTPSIGTVEVGNYDIIKDYRKTRSQIGLVPQELTLEQFEIVYNNVSYTRGLYGKPPNPQHIEKILKEGKKIGIIPEKKYYFLDKILLGVLSQYNHIGEAVFYKMIKRNPTKRGQ